MPRLGRYVLLAAAASLIAATSAGVTVAASKASTGAKACVRNNGVLAVPAANGKCPAHTNKTTLGKRGPAGPPGQPGAIGPTGPSRAYADNEGAAVALGSSHDVATLTLPAGFYVFTGQAQLLNYNASNITEATCVIKAGTSTSPTYITTVPEGIEVFTYTSPGTITMAVTASGRVPRDQQVTLTCGDVGGATSTQAYGSLTAERVGAVTTTGDGGLT